MKCTICGKEGEVDTYDVWYEGSTKHDVVENICQECADKIYPAVDVIGVKQ